MSHRRAGVALCLLLAAACADCSSIDQGLQKPAGIVPSCAAYSGIGRVLPA